MSDLLYKCSNLDFHYFLGDTKIHALSDVSLDIHSKDFMCILGPSGSGKSTLLSQIGLIEEIQEGEILFQGQNLKTVSEKVKNSMRRNDLGFVFQMFNLIPILTAYENVEYFLIKQGVPKKERHLLVTQALEMVGLQDQMHKQPMQMSGGQRQRVAIARAVVKRPKVIIADEPTASLDQKTGHEIMEILQDLNQKEGVCIILASHDPMVIDMVNRKVRLVDGVIVEDVKC
ncbi:MAG: ABC transporter ATP-binding protein [Bacteriovoracaceae bacterium]|nr:ABC transporter ATP-binding protein [Bacteriovoracaceae bacterium]